MPIHHNLLGHVPTDTDRIRNYLANEELGAKHCSAHENVLNPGAEVPAHMHQVEEVIVCLDGEGECSLGNAVPVRYTSGSVIIIPPNTPHILRNVGSVNLRQICFFAGNPTHTRWVGSEGSVSDVSGPSAA